MQLRPDRALKGDEFMQRKLARVAVLPEKISRDFCPEGKSTLLAARTFERSTDKRGVAKPGKRAVVRVQI